MLISSQKQKKKGLVSGFFSHVSLEKYRSHIYIIHCVIVKDSGNAFFFTAFFADISSSAVALLFRFPGQNLCKKLTAAHCQPVVLLMGGAGKDHRAAGIHISQLVSGIFRSAFRTRRQDTPHSACIGHRAESGGTCRVQVHDTGVSFS